MAFLLNAQKANGSFASYSSPSCWPFTPEKQYRTPFPSSLILSCLQGWRSEVAQKVTQRLTRYVERQASERGSWNYWDRTSTEFIKQPYPDDLDDTFCALAALPITGKRMAQAVKMLIATETKPGGPYRTWLVGTKADAHWLDVDPVVNANIGRFLHGQGVATKGLERYVRARLRAGNGSRYYPDHYSLWWFASYWVKVNLALVTEDHAFTAPKTPLQAALVLASFLRWGGEPTKAGHLVTYLLAAQRQGTWPAEGFCLDPARDGTLYYAGSEALTTAFCLHALHLYAAQVEQRALREHQQEVRKAVEARLTHCFSVIPFGFAERAKVLQKIKAVEQRTPLMTLATSTAMACGKSLSMEKEVALGTATALGWVAYTIVDDFLDGDGVLPTLPSALLAQRELLQLYAGVSSQRFAAAVATTMNTMDRVNTWEVTTCRFSAKIGVLPSYGNLQVLADRSLGHLLTPLAVLHLLHLEPGISDLTTFFQHFLIARQLSDDALDWQSDLGAGHINAVAEVLLREEKLPITLTAATYKRLEKRFQESGKLAVQQLLRKHLEKTEYALTKLSAAKIVTQPHYLRALTAPLWKIVISAEQAQELAAELTKSYRSS